jgi:hypothetical protein
LLSSSLIAKDFLIFSKKIWEISAAFFKGFMCHKMLLLFSSQLTLSLTQSNILIQSFENIENQFLHFVTNCLEEEKVIPLSIWPSDIWNLLSLELLLIPPKPFFHWNVSTQFKPFFLFFILDLFNLYLCDIDSDNPKTKCKCSIVHTLMWRPVTLTSIFFLKK